MLPSVVLVEKQRVLKSEYVIYTNILNIPPPVIKPAFFIHSDEGTDLIYNVGS